MSDKFLFLPEVASQFGKSVTHLRKIAEAQHGVFTKARFSSRALASYPSFTRGPGGRWGIFESQLAAYWESLRNRARDVQVAATRMPRTARNRRS